MKSPPQGADPSAVETAGYLGEQEVQAGVGGTGCGLGEVRAWQSGVPRLHLAGEPSGTWFPTR